MRILPCVVMRISFSLMGASSLGFSTLWYRSILLPLPSSCTHNTTQCGESPLRSEMRERAGERRLGERERGGEKYNGVQPRRARLPVVKRGRAVPGGYLVGVRAQAVASSANWR